MSTTHPITPDDIPALTSWFKQGEKPANRWAVGTETEIFVLDKDTLAPLPYAGERSVRAMLEALARAYGWTEVFEGPHLIALQRDGWQVTIEPGGQFELAGPPTRDLKASRIALLRHLDELYAVGDELGVRWMWAGVNPIHNLSEIPLIPKGRFRVMLAYMTRVGGLGGRMMMQTCAVQSTVDYRDEVDAGAKLRAAFAVSPIVTAIFANSPFMGGRPTGYRSYRAHIWRHLDKPRCGALDIAFEPDFSFDRFVQRVLDLPMFFIIRDGTYIDVDSIPFRRYLTHPPDGIRPTLDDWALHTTTIYWDARLRQQIELRGADAVPPKMLFALPTLWTGILYSPDARRAALELVGSKLIGPLDHTTCEEGRRAVARDALGGRFAGHRVGDLASELLAIARAGHAEFGTPANEVDELLAPLDSIVAERRTLADRLIAIYQSKGGGAAGMGAVRDACLQPLSRPPQSF